jgi:hypothetical protein
VVPRITRPVVDPPTIQHRCAVGHEMEYKPSFEIPAVAGYGCSAQVDPPVFVATMMAVPLDDAPRAQQAVAEAHESDRRCALFRLGGYESTVHVEPPSLVEIMASDVRVAPIAQQSVGDTQASENRWPSEANAVPTDVPGRF